MRLRDVLTDIYWNISSALQDTIEDPMKKKRRIWQTGNGQRKRRHAHEINQFHAGCTELHPPPELVLGAVTKKAE